MELKTKYTRFFIETKNENRICQEERFFVMKHFILEQNLQNYKSRQCGLLNFLEATSHF